MEIRLNDGAIAACDNFEPKVYKFFELRFKIKLEPDRLIQFVFSEPEK